MKMCFIASAASIHSHKWINFFSKLGYEILWISNDPTNIKISNNIDYYEVQSNFFLSIIEIRQLVSKFNPNFIHVHYLGFNALMGLFLGDRTIISTAWGSDININNNSLLKKFIVTKILKKSRLITCDAMHMRNTMMQMGIDEKKINIINFGIDTNHFSNKKTNKHTKNNEFKVISLRDFEPIYDIECLINAIPIVLDKFPNTYFELLGRGTLKKHIMSLVQNMKLNNSVTFIDYIENKNMPVILSNADILVSTSLSDAGIAGSTAEAMSCELPVVVTNSGENSNWINHGDNGFLVEVSNPQELAKYIIILLENKQLRYDVGKKARSKILAMNDYVTEMQKMLNLYKKLLK